jgi:hypothetical protein
MNQTTFLAGASSVTRGNPLPKRLQAPAVTRFAKRWKAEAAERKAKADAAKARREHAKEADRLAWELVVAVSADKVVTSYHVWIATEALAERAKAEGK